jgi:Na+/melibiose symporter-like transporter
LLAYAAVALPLAMIGLPVYVQIPKFYHESFGLELGTLGALLLGVRLLDAVLDPALGHCSDLTRQRGWPRLAGFAIGVPLLLAGSTALFVPPALSAGATAAWLAAASLLCYGALSLLQICHHAHGAEMARAPLERTRITAWREALGLIGILGGAALPACLAPGDDAAGGFARFVSLFAVLLIIGAGITWQGAPAAVILPTATAPGPRLRESWTLPLANPGFRWLAAIHLCNGTSAAIPATLVLFFVEDVIARPALAGLFLALYFLTGALAMPLWPRLAARLGTAPAWGVSMIFAAVVFAGSFVLEAGDTLGFGLICALSGLALGADLALPPVLLAGVIERDEHSGHGYRGGVYFGLWALIGKLAVAFAAGIALPLVATLGYVPGSGDHPGTRALAACYALLPCVLKLTALALLWRAPACAGGMPLARSAHHASLV